MISPPILEPILVGIGMFTGGMIWILTHGHLGNPMNFSWTIPEFIDLKLFGKTILVVIYKTKNGAIRSSESGPFRSVLGARGRRRRPAARSCGHWRRTTPRSASDASTIWRRSSRGPQRRQRVSGDWEAGGKGSRGLAWFRLLRLSFWQGGEEKA